MTPGLRYAVTLSSRALSYACAWCIVGITALAQQSAASGPEALKQLSLEELAQVQVTSVNKDPVPAFRTPAAITVLNQSDIHRSGARTLPDLLRLVPGVDVAQISSNDWAIGIRGFEGKLSKAVLVLIDGRSVYTPLFAGVYWDMQGVLIEDIDRIEVIRGPGGTIWGSNAVNGVINIITKSARETRGELVSAGGGNVDQGFLDWRYGGGTDDLSYRIYGTGFTNGPQLHADARNFDDWRRGQLGFRMDWRATPRDEVTVQGDAYAGEAGQKLQLSTFDPPTNPAVEGDKLFNGQNIMAAWRRVLKSGADLQVRAYVDRTDRQELNYQETRNTLDLDFINHIPWRRHDLTWGLGARVSPSTYTQTLPTVDFEPHQQTYNIFSAFLQDDISIITDRVSLTIGSKFEHTTFSGFNAQPSARVSWTPTSKQTVWAGVTRAIRTASRIEDNFSYSFLVQPNPPLYLQLIGDGGFTQEQSVAYELGYRHYINARGFISVALFHNRYDDLLSVENRPVTVETTPAPTHLVLPLLFRNGILANTTGGEVSTLWDFTAWLRVRGSYSLAKLDAKRALGSNDASTVKQLEGDTPQHKIVIQASLTLPHKIDLNAAYRYVSSVPDQKVPSYNTADARLSKRLGEHFELEIAGQNLLQPGHVEYGGLPGPLIAVRRSGYLALTWTH